MSNPFPAKFGSICSACEAQIPQGDDMYAVDGQFICKQCADDAGNVCPDCGNFKPSEYDQCYDCHEDGEEADDQSVDIDDVPF